MAKKTIYYAIAEQIEVPDSLTDEEIDDLIASISGGGKDFVWSEDADILDFDQKK